MTKGAGRLVRLDASGPDATHLARGVDAPHLVVRGVDALRPDV